MRSIHDERDGQTDGQTDRRTPRDGIGCAIASIARQKAIAQIIDVSN